MEVYKIMEDIGAYIKPLIDQELKILWENKSNAYNSMLNHLKKKGLKEKELVIFTKLLNRYLQFI